MEAKDSAWRCHVLVLTFPFGSHASSLLGFIGRVADEAPDVKFSFFNFSKSNRSIFSTGKLSDNIKPYGFSDGLPEGYVIGSNPMEPIELFLKAASKNLKSAIETAVAETGLEVRCLVSDAFLWFVGEIAEEMKVPWVPVWTSGPRSLVLHVYTDLIRQKLGDSSVLGDDDEKAIDSLPGFAEIRRIDLPEGIVHGDLESPFATMLYKVGQILPKASVVVLNCFEEAEPEMFDILKSTFQRLLNVAPINLTSRTSTVSDEHDCLEWLDKQKSKSVAYISFGSFATLPPPELAALAEALEESGVPFLWSFRGNPEENFSEDFLRTVDLRGKLVPWVPQPQVLAHASVGVFITHGGWNSVLEAIVAGVPMICRPFVGDHGLNTRTVEAVWRIGLGLFKGILTKAGVMRAMELILDSQKGEEIRNKLKALQDLILKAAEPNGSSTKNFNAFVEFVTK